MESICVESTNYARLKGNHMFTMTVEKLKAFLTILLVSRYAYYQDKRCIGKDEKTTIM